MNSNTSLDSLPLRQMRVIDTHTGGEPTRVIVSGGPALNSRTLSEMREELRTHHDYIRRAVVCEPRGSDVLVGALLVPPGEPNCEAGIIFFNNVGYLGMCGHGTIGVAVALGFLARLKRGTHRFDTPVGPIACHYDGSATVSIDNVPSYRLASQVSVSVGDYGTVIGDIAWGGNWFFLISNPPVSVIRENLDSLSDFTWQVRQALQRHNITGDNGEEIDHIEVFGPPLDSKNHSRNYVLCPGRAYDRSPCGTGTSAKIACLAADGKLAPGEVWRQESIVGSVFEASYQWSGDKILPTIRGTAYVNAEMNLVFDSQDPFALGIY